MHKRCRRTGKWRDQVAETESVRAEESEVRRDNSTAVIAAALVVVLVAIVVVVWAMMRSSMPGNDSVEAGFARDMGEHHQQAVEMALIMSQRAEYEDLRFISTDMMLVQQAQIGQMRGWMDVWGLHPMTGSVKMEWMDHPTSGLMPGMATAEEIDLLRTLPVEEAQDHFLRLMIIHHQAGVEMADAAIERSSNEAMVNLARNISLTQVAEIENLQRVRDRLDLERVVVEQQIHSGH